MPADLPRLCCLTWLPAAFPTHSALVVRCGTAAPPARMQTGGRVGTAVCARRWERLGGQRRRLGRRQQLRQGRGSSRAAERAHFSGTMTHSVEICLLIVFKVSNSVCRLNTNSPEASLCAVAAAAAACWAGALNCQLRLGRRCCCSPTTCCCTQRCLRPESRSPGRASRPRQGTQAYAPGSLHAAHGLQQAAATAQVRPHGAAASARAGTAPPAGAAAAPSSWPARARIGGAAL